MSNKDELLKLAKKQKKSKTKRKPKGKSLAEKLLKLTDYITLFKSPQGDLYVKYPIDDHSEFDLINSPRFKLFLTQQCYLLLEKPITNNALSDVCRVLRSKAEFRGVVQEVNIRVAGYEDKIYIDLVNDKWEVVEIDKDGWRIIINPPVNFIRPKGMLPLPKPVQGGDLKDFLNLVNLDDETDGVLLLSFLVMCLNPFGPYPHLEIQGPQGSAKSTLSDMCRRLIDPYTAHRRVPPKDARDIMISSARSWMLTYDNLSGVPQWFSDILCVLSTGGGYATRKLYEDDEEKLFDAKRPVILNGINGSAQRPDLVDRIISIKLRAITDEERIEESVFWKNFEELQPQILGALYNSLSVSLKNYDEVLLTSKPRMADFARVSVAAESSFPYPEGTFFVKYLENREEAMEVAFESDIIGIPVVQLLGSDECKGFWEGVSSIILSTSIRIYLLFSLKKDEGKI
jgi:hypothetical protein